MPSLAEFPRASRGSAPLDPLCIWSPMPSHAAELLGDKLRAEVGELLAEQAGAVHKKRRRRLGALLDAFRPHTSAPWRKDKHGRPLPSRLACCGYQRHETTTAVLALGEGTGRPRTQLAGIIRCRSKACPYCLAVRKSNDARTIERVCADHHDAFDQSTTYLATFTMRNQSADNLAETWAGVSKSFSRLLGTRAWVGTPERPSKRGGTLPAVLGARDKLGLADFVIGQETTHGMHGWHVHLHILFLPRRDPYTARELVRVRRVLFCLWSRAVRRQLGPARMPAYMRRDDDGRLRHTGVDVRACKSDEYLAKLGLDLGRELADGGAKVARVAHARAPLELLADWADHKDARALLLYQVFERATRGTADLTWSKGLRPFRDLARAELRDEWIRERAVARTLVVIPGGLSDQLAHIPGALCDVQEAAERAGTAGAVRAVACHLGEAAGAEVAELTEQHERTRREWACLGPPELFAG